MLGFDDLEAAGFPGISLTTVRQPLEEIGRTTAELLIDRCEGRPLRENYVVLRGELVVRGSTRRKG